MSKQHGIGRSLKIQLCVAMSNAHIDLNRNAKKAMRVLEELLMDLRSENIELQDLSPRDRAKINLGLGKAYRYIIL